MDGRTSLFHAARSAGIPFSFVVLVLAGLASDASASASCPGSVRVQGLGGDETVSLVPTGWPNGGSLIEALDGRMVVPHMGGRVYFASQCTAGTYKNEQYLALNLLGKRLRYTTDMSGSGCGCNAALYLVSMHQNTAPSTCNDFYCDANSVCGIACAEIDIQEANQHAWHSTLHTKEDHSGMGVGYGGGQGWNGPRDFTSDQYGPGARCIDTTKPFEVDVSFPTDGSGTLVAMEVKLSQEGKPCDVTMKVAGYGGMAELSQALAAGMTPVISYWSDDAMLWMDGAGVDGRGPCQHDNAAACTDSVKFYDFSILDIGSGSSTAPPTVRPKVDESWCPGSFPIRGIGQVSLVRATLNVPGQAAGFVEVQNAETVMPHMSGRAYFADACELGKYDHKQYLGLKLLGKTFSYTTDMSSAGCGCNAALYLVSMKQNEDRSGCEDFYCDANSVCQVPCAEVDIQEANQFAWHSTLHASWDKAGQGSGYGGGIGWNGPRDFTGGQYGPGGTCIDTSKPFEVAASFPVDARGRLQKMEVTLSQTGHSCELKMAVEDYKALADVGEALGAGMTPVISYWAADDMLWMDGKGQDGAGPCAHDDAGSCPEAVRFYNFSVFDIGSPPPSPVKPEVPVKDNQNESTYRITIALSASELPTSWRDGAEIAIGSEGVNLHATIESIASSTSTSGSAPTAGKAASGSGGNTSIIVAGVAAVLVFAVMAFIAWRSCAQHVPAEVWENAKANLDSNSSCNRSVRPLFVNNQDVQSPIRRRHVSGQTPLTRGGGGRFPTLEQSDGDSTPKTTPQITQTLPGRLFSRRS